MFLPSNPHTVRGHSSSLMTLKVIGTCSPTIINLSVHFPTIFRFVPVIPEISAVGGWSLDFSVSVKHDNRIIFVEDPESKRK